MRDILTGLAILLILALTAALAGPYFVDWGAQRGRIAERLTELVGAPVEIAGDIRVRLLPEPHLELGEIRVGHSDGPTLSADRLALEMAVTPLLRGEIRIVEAVLERPLVASRLDAAGGVEGLSRLTERWGVVQDVAVERLVVRNGTVVLTEADGRMLTAESVGFDADAQALAGPWRASGRATLSGVPLDLRLATGAPEAGGVRVKIVAQVAGGVGRGEIDGRFQAGEGGPRFDGRVATVGRLRWPERDGFAQRPWSLTGTVRLAGRQGRIEALELDAGGDEVPLKLMGSGELTWGAVPRASLALEAKQLDLDKPFTLQGGTAPSVRAVAAAWLNAFAQDEDAQGTDLPLAVQLKIGTVLAGGEAITGLAAEFGVRATALQLTSLKATLPGAAALSASGELGFAGGPRFAGRVDIKAKDAPRLAGWWP
ncbi:MAG: AsmA family protein, partial [Alsobacter sp.]